MIQRIGITAAVIATAFLGAAVSWHPVDQAVAEVAPKAIVKHAPKVIRAAVVRQEPVAVELKVLGAVILTVKELPFEIEGPSGADFYDWSFDQTQVRAYKLGNKLTVQEMPAGEFDFALTATTIDFVKDENGDYQKQRKVQVGVTKIYNGTQPNPPPDPDPDPDPTPSVQRLVILEESGRRTPEQQALYVQVRTAMDELPPTQIYDQDSEAGQQYKPMADDANVALPCVIFLDADGGAVDVKPLPTDFASFKDLVGGHQQ